MMLGGLNRTFQTLVECWKEEKPSKKVSRKGLKEDALFKQTYFRDNQNRTPDIRHKLKYSSKSVKEERKTRTYRSNLRQEDKPNYLDYFNPKIFKYDEEKYEEKNSLDLFQSDLSVIIQYDEANLRFQFKPPEKDSGRASSESRIDFVSNRDQPPSITPEKNQMKNTNSCLNPYIFTGEKKQNLTSYWSQMGKIDSTNLSQRRSSFFGMNRANNEKNSRSFRSIKLKRPPMAAPGGTFLDEDEDHFTSISMIHSASLVRRSKRYSLDKLKRKRKKNQSLLLKLPTQRFQKLSSNGWKSILNNVDDFSRIDNFSHHIFHGGQKADRNINLSSWYKVNPNNLIFLQSERPNTTQKKHSLYHQELVQQRKMICLSAAVKPSGSSSISSLDEENPVMKPISVSDERTKEISNKINISSLNNTNSSTNLIPKQTDEISTKSSIDWPKQTSQLIINNEDQNPIIDEDAECTSVEESDLLLLHMEQLNCLLSSDPKFINARTSPLHDTKLADKDWDDNDNRSNASTSETSLESMISNQSKDVDRHSVKSVQSKASFSSLGKIYNWWCQKRLKIVSCLKPTDDMDGTPLEYTGPPDIRSQEEEEFWGRLIHQYPQLSTKDTKLLARYILLNGIPSSLRSLIWPLLCQSIVSHQINKSNPTDRNKSINPSSPFQSPSSPTNFGFDVQYRHLLSLSSHHERWIRRDVSRTFPAAPFYTDPNGHGQLALFSLMKAYSIYDPIVGYCQGLSFIGGILLLQMPEEDAFGVLVRLMYAYDLRKNFMPGMEGLHCTLYQFDSLFARFCPILHAHFQGIGLHSNMYASQWFLTLFAYRLPFGLVFRLFDWILAEGFSVTFRIAIALLSIHSSQLLECDFEEALEFLKNKLPKMYTDDMLEVELLESSSYPMNGNDEVYWKHINLFNRANIDSSSPEMSNHNEFSSNDDSSQDEVSSNNATENRSNLSSRDDPFTFLSHTASWLSFQQQLPLNSQGRVSTFSGPIGPKGVTLLEKAAEVKIHPKLLLRLKNQFEQEMNKITSANGVTKASQTKETLIRYHSATPYCFHAWPSKGGPRQHHPSSLLEDLQEGSEGIERYNGIHLSIQPNPSPSSKNEQPIIVNLIVPPEMISPPDYQSLAPLNDTTKIESWRNRCAEYEAILYILSRHHSSFLAFNQYLVSKLSHALNVNALLEGQLSHISDRLESLDIITVTQLEGQIIALKRELANKEKKINWLEDELVQCKCQLVEKQLVIENEHTQKLALEKPIDCKDYSSWLLFSSDTRQRRQTEGMSRLLHQ